MWAPRVTLATCRRYELVPCFCVKYPFRWTHMSEFLKIVWQLRDIDVISNAVS
jgi:hypothetical protein